MLVLLNEDYEPLEIYEAQREDILDSVSSSNSKRSNRGAISVAKFKFIATLVWSAEDGLIEDGIWDNQI